MGRKMKFPFLFKSTETAAAAAAWPWPACVNNHKTLSFRMNPAAASDIYKTMNSAFVDDRNMSETISETADSFFSIRRGASLPSTPGIPEPTENDDSAVFRGLRSDRLFFEPGGETSSILGEAKSGRDSYGERAALVAVDSRDPVSDFRASMAEMVEAHGLRDWESLEDLLACYLRVNPRPNHGFIASAFVDLMSQLVLAGDLGGSSSSAVDEQCSSSSTATQGSFTSPLSFSSSTYSSNSPYLSVMGNEGEIIAEKSVNVSSSFLSSSSGHQEPEKQCF